ncbi:hypothetical protein PS15p_204602 [Mucor circinelloides]
MIFVPADNCKPGVAKVSFGELLKIGIQPGAWVQVLDGHGTVYHCSIWPADMPENHIMASPFIQFKTSDTEISSSSSIIPIDSVATAIKVELSYKLNKKATEEQQLLEFGFVFDKATEAQKHSYMRHTVDANVICKGAIIRKTPLISMQVISTYPEGQPVFVASASQVSVVDGDTSKQDQVSELEKSLEAMSIASDLDKSSNMSSLQKAYNALYEVVCFPFLYKDWINQLGIECPKGVLLYGPPGVGKTFLVSSIARKCNAELFIIQGPEVFGPFIGESEEKLRAKFTQARDYAIKENVPVILFIDEIDALTPKRDSAQSHENRMVAQLLTLMDGIESRGRLVIVGATNRPNAIDSALRRPGRFDREIHMEPPNATDRYSLFEAQITKMPLESSVDIEALAAMTNGYVAADINSVCREAAMSAVQRASKEKEMEVYVSMLDFTSAFATVGPSMQRGFQVQVDKMKWDDVGGLEDVKKVQQVCVDMLYVQRTNLATEIEASCRMAITVQRFIQQAGVKASARHSALWTSWLQ